MKGLLLSTPLFSPPVLRQLATLLCQAGANRRLAIIYYHQVLPQPDPLRPRTLTHAQFRQQMALLAQHFNVLSLGEALARLTSGVLPPRAVVITFDDGYADNYRVALPILQAEGLTATFFIAVGFLNGGRMWNDTVIEALRLAPAGELDLTPLALGRYAIVDDGSRARVAEAIIDRVKYLPFDERYGAVQALADQIGGELPNDLMMSHDELIALHRAGMTIGGHTVNHPILAQLDDAVAEREISECKESLEGIIGEPLEFFSYPNGRKGQDYAPQHVAMTKAAGYRAAVTTEVGVSTRQSDPFQLARFTPWDREPRPYMARLVLNYRRAVA